MLGDPVTLTITSLPPRVDTCQLCGREREPLDAAILIRHVSGATIDFEACSRCTAALRRVIAAAGGATAGGPAHVRFAPDEPLVQRPAPEAVAADTVGEPILVHELADAFVGEDGQPYVVQVMGQGRADGTWLGWLTFVAPDGRAVLRTPRETTQSNRDHLVYWARGLEPSFLEGAFRRAG